MQSQLPDRTERLSPLVYRYETIQRPKTIPSRLPSKPTKRYFFACPLFSSALRYARYVGRSVHIRYSKCLVHSANFTFFSLLYSINLKMRHCNGCFLSLLLSSLFYHHRHRHDDHSYRRYYCYRYCYIIVVAFIFTTILYKSVP